MHGYAQHLNVSAVILEGLSLVCMEVYRRHIEFNVISIDTAPTWELKYHLRHCPQELMQPLSGPVGVSQDSGQEEVGRDSKGPSW